MIFQPSLHLIKCFCLVHFYIGIQSLQTRFSNEWSAWFPACKSRDIVTWIENIGVDLLQFNPHEVGILARIHVKTGIKLRKLRIRQGCSRSFLKFDRQAPKTAGAVVTVAVSAVEIKPLIAESMPKILDGLKRGFGGGVAAASGRSVEFKGQFERLSTSNLLGQLFKLSYIFLNMSLMFWSAS